MMVKTPSEPTPGMYPTGTKARHKSAISNTTEKLRRRIQR